MLEMVLFLIFASVYIFTLCFFAIFHQLSSFATVYPLVIGPPVSGLLLPSMSSPVVLNSYDLPVIAWPFS